MPISRKQNFVIVTVLVVLFILGAYLFFQNNKNILFKIILGVSSSATKTVTQESSNTAPIQIVKQESLPKPLANPPAIIRGVYVTSWSASSKKYLEYLDQLFKTTQINTVVIDLKDSSGTIFYNSAAPMVQEYKTSQNIYDIDDLVRHFHGKGIYVIARINVFNDSALAKARPDLAAYKEAASEGQPNHILWQDNLGFYCLDPASKEVQDYNIQLAKDVLSHGVDEVNFDYIRFPSDGNINDIAYPVWDGVTLKRDIIKSFFKNIRESLSDSTISADLFGQTTTSTDDMGVGQVIESAFLYFDYVCPMVYPSHYVDGFLGYDNPARHPYEVIKYSLDSAVLRREALAKADSSQKIGQLRPWLQDFNLKANYGAGMVDQEIQATQDSLGESFNGFLLWNAGNYYTQDAVLK